MAQQDPTVSSTRYFLGNDRAAPTPPPPHAPLQDPEVSSTVVAMGIMAGQEEAEEEAERRRRALELWRQQRRLIEQIRSAERENNRRIRRAMGLDPETSDDDTEEDVEEGSEAERSS